MFRPTVFNRFQLASTALAFSACAGGGASDESVAASASTDAPLAPVAPESNDSSPTSSSTTSPGLSSPASVSSPGTPPPSGNPSPTALSPSATASSSPSGAPTGAMPTPVHSGSGAATSTGGVPSAAGGGTGGTSSNAGGDPVTPEGGTPNAAGGAASGGKSSGGSAGSGQAGAPPSGSLDVCDPAGFSQVITVAKGGTADFDTVQAAVDSVSSNNQSPVLVQIARGSYKEKLSINRRFVTFCGESADTTTLTYDQNNEAAGGTSASASTTIDSDDFSAVNITFENSRPMGSGQAVAILLKGERQQFLDCRFMGFQDTLYVHDGSQYFRNCYVQGTVDYIFGGARAVLEDCTMYNAGGGSAVTAPNTDLSEPYGIVFLGGELTAAPSVGTDAVALGRPWGPDGSTTFIRTVLGDYIKKVGWVEMSGNQPGNARFAEYQTTGPGASPGTRVAGSRQLSDAEAAQYTVENVLGGWTPSFSQ